MGDDLCLNIDHNMHTIMFFLIIAVIILLILRLYIDILIVKEKMKP